MMRLVLKYEEIIVAGWPTHKVATKLQGFGWPDDLLIGVDERISIGVDLKLWCLGQYGYSKHDTWLVVKDFESGFMEAIYFAKKSDALIFVTRWQAVMLDWNGVEV